jgi:hypothetical protein
MSRLAAFSFESVTSATAEIYAQIKKAIGTGPNTFAAIAGIGTDEFLNLEGSVRSRGRPRPEHERERDLIEAGLNEAAGGGALWG